MPQFICHILIKDDVNSVNLVRRVFLRDDAESSDAMLEKLKQLAHSAVSNELEITNDSRPSLNQIIVQVDCQEFAKDGVLELSENAAIRTPTYRSWSKHL